MTALAFIDTETTSLRPDRRAWEIGLIRREWLPKGDDGSLLPVEAEYRWQVRHEWLDLGNAEPISLKIGGFHDRYVESKAVGEPDVLAEVNRLLAGAHLVGNVVSFDAEVLAARMRANNICPSWHYHLIDIEAMAVGYLYSHAENFPGSMAADFIKTGLPWNSEALSRAVGVDPPSDEERHTALGDARWVMRLYDSITGGK